MKKGGLSLIEFEFGVLYEFGVFGCCGLLVFVF
jgi:hypothetical protein